MVIIFIFIFGLAVGSFLNAYIYRLHAGKSALKGRSFCPKCKHTLSAKDLIPVFSFVFLRGKCRYCAKSISWQYPLIEAATAILFTIGYACILNGKELTALNILQFVFFIYIISVLIVIFVYDIKHYLILDKVTVPAFFVMLFFTILIQAYKTGFPKDASFLELAKALIPYGLGILLGGGFFFLQFIISNGKWIGGGDIRLGVLMGVVLGIRSVASALFIAYVAGSFIALGFLLVKKKKFESHLPFGAFLVPATVIAFLCGDAIFSWYVHQLY